MKMLLKRNLLENITIISNCGTLFCILLHYLTNISLLTGKWFLLYILAVFIVSAFFSFRIIQWLLHLNRPLCYDLDSIVEKYPYLAPLRGVLPEIPKQTQLEWKEYDTNELSVISTVLERKLVSSWYVPFISQDIGFPFACKQMLDQMIGRAFQICSKIETKDVFVDICTIFILHLKEYEKAVKRQEKSPSSTVESHYKKSHPISDPEQKYSSVEHCTNILRIIIKELLPWELRETPHSELLVRILSKKLDSFIESTIADPAWLNDKLMTYLTGEEYVEVKEEDSKDKKAAEETVPEDNKVLENVESHCPENDVLEIKEETQSKTECVEGESVVTPELKDVKSSPVLRQKRGRQGRNEVKIYDRIIEGSVKTWETDMDLQCISLGQDLLASLDGEITLSRLWGHEEPEGSPEARKSPLWAGGEEEALELGGRSPSPRLPSPKAADALLALQASVTQAKHKIGDLQVKELDVYDTSDEAAGMMEGLLDFGIAGLKKGLRFTGLSDDSQKSPSHGRDKSPPLEWHKSRGDIADQAVTALAQKEDNGNGLPHLIKQHRVSSQDSVPSQPRAIPIPASESPEPQYEEAADLSTSIAKLRRLLRQRADSGTQQHRGEEVWWEGAEETRGRTLQHDSSRPVDTATLADEYDMSMERNSPNQTSNNMQRLDKLFHRTVTGVFNSLKTAVGAEEQGAPHAHAQQWAYVQTNNELTVCVVAARLAWSRRARGVEAALDSLQMQQQPREPPPQPEDLEEWLSVFGRAWSAVGVGTRALHSHVAHRLAALLCAETAESLISSWLDGLTRWLRERLFQLFARVEEGGALSTETKRPFDEELTCAVIVDKMPVLKLIFGEETVFRSVRSAVRGVGGACAARDVAYRMLDILALHFKRAAMLRNPSFDAN